MRPWQQEVAAQVAGITVPLLTLSAACLGTQLTLSSENLPFGNIVLGSKVTYSQSGALIQPCLVLSDLYGDTCTLVFQSKVHDALVQQNRLTTCNSACLTTWTLRQRITTLPW